MWFNEVALAHSWRQRPENMSGWSSTKLEDVGVRERARDYDKLRLESERDRRYGIYLQIHTHNHLPQILNLIQILIQPVFLFEVTSSISDPSQFRLGSEHYAAALMLNEFQNITSMHQYREAISFFSTGRWLKVCLRSFVQDVNLFSP